MKTAAALAVLLVAALPPLLIGAPAIAIAVLDLMHVVTAAVVLWALTGESSARAPR